MMEIIISGFRLRVSGLRKTRDTCVKFQVSEDRGQRTDHR
jgi:hypothetical protein